LLRVGKQKSGIETGSVEILQRMSTDSS